MIKTLIPVAGFILINQGISEVLRCVIAIKTGQWPERQDDVLGNRKKLMREAKRNN